MKKQLKFYSCQMFWGSRTTEQVSYKEMCIWLAVLRTAWRCQRDNYNNLPIVRRECIFVIMWNIDLHALSVVFSRLFQLKLHIQLLWCIKYILLPKLWKYLEYVQLDNFSEKAKNGGPSSAHLSWICFYIWPKTLSVITIGLGTLT
jgi:hypothetical protein